jgi:hypothetical protein
MGKQGEHADHTDEPQGNDKHEGNEKHEGVMHKLAEEWHHLEDATGGRAQIPLAGDQQESNFEGIEHHQDAERH